MEEATAEMTQNQNICLQGPHRLKGKIECAYHNYHSLAYNLSAAGCELQDKMSDSRVWITSHFII